MSERVEVKSRPPESRWKVARDDQFQLGGEEHVQQWTEHRPLRHAEQYALYRRQVTAVRDLLCAISHERAYSSAVFVRTNATSSPCSRISWWTQSNAAERSNKPSSVTSRTLADVSTSDQTRSMAVSVECFFLYEALGRSQTGTR